MLRKITSLFALFLLTANISFAQWTFEGAFPDTSIKGQAHGMAVDPDGKVWASDWGNINLEVAPGDTIKGVRVIHVFEANGTKAPFSPIYSIMGDTLYDVTTRGMRADIDGNILVTTGSRTLYELDYKTGLGLQKVAMGINTSPTAPAVSDDGTIFVGPVVPGDSNPLEMYDANFTLLGNALPSTVGFSRSFEVSADGKNIYWSGYTTGKIYVYSRADEFSDFALADSILEGFHSESLTWNPATKYLWASAGSFNDLPENGYTPGTWYAYDFATKTVVDSLAWNFTTPGSSGERPRSLAFTSDGNTAYVGVFGASGVPLVQKFTKGTTGIKELTELPTGYNLSQNYPNPFNPTTNIKFSIPETGFVTLKVYNTLGQEVATLINEIKSTGTYEVDFNASKLSSGMYVYTLSSGNIHISNKMILMK